MGALKDALSQQNDQSLLAVSKAFDKLIVSHKRLRVAQNELIAAALEVIGVSWPDLMTAHPESFERLRLAVLRAKEVYAANE